MAAVCLCFMVMTSTTDSVAQSTGVGMFHQWPHLSASPWRTVQIDPKVAQTHYQIREWDGIISVEATAQASMTLLARPLHLDLNQTPVLCWRWRIEAPLKTANMLLKKGDDYAARIYITFDIPDQELQWHS